MGITSLCNLRKVFITHPHAVSHNSWNLTSLRLSSICLGTIQQTVAADGVCRFFVIKYTFEHLRTVLFLIELKVLLCHLVSFLTKRLSLTSDWKKPSAGVQMNIFQGVCILVLARRHLWTLAAYRHVRKCMKLPSAGVRRHISVTVRITVDQVIAAGQQQLLTQPFKGGQLLQESYIFHCWVCHFHHLFLHWSHA